MDFSIKSYDAKNPISALKTGCIAVAVFEEGKLSREAKSLDAKGLVSAAIKSGDISGKPGATLLLRNASATAERILLVGLGKEGDISDKNFNSALQAVARSFASLGAADAVLALPFNQVKNREPGCAIRSSVLALRENAYRFDAMKSKKEPAPRGVRKIALAMPAAETAAAKITLAHSIALANGMDLTKDLGNLPANVCTAAIANSLSGMINSSAVTTSSETGAAETRHNAAAISPAVATPMLPR